MLDVLVKVAVATAVVVVGTVGFVAVTWLLRKWPYVLHDVLAPWARKHDYQGMLTFLIKVDDLARGVRRLLILFKGIEGERAHSKPVLVTEVTIREADLPPELRKVGEHDWSIDTRSLEHGLSR